MSETNDVETGLEVAFDDLARVLKEAADRDGAMADLTPPLECLRIIQYVLAADGLTLSEARSITKLVGLETSQAWSSGHPDLVIGLAGRIAEQPQMTFEADDLRKLYRRVGALDDGSDQGILDRFHLAVERLMRAAAKVDGIRSDNEKALLEELSEMRKVVGSG